MHNTLFYGDNLDILHKYIADASVDLIYLDPPFNSNRSYSVLFKNEAGVESEASVRAFNDTWHWGQQAEDTYLALVTQGSAPVANMITAMRQFIGTNQMMAYLVMMAARLVELHRVLKPTGSIYLHCDPTASHYLKVVMDTIFGPTNFLSEVVWKRTSAHSSAKRYGPVHDVILLYGKSPAYLWVQQYEAFSESYLASHYGSIDATGRHYTLSDLTAAGVRRGQSGLAWRGFDPTAKGNHWKFTVERLDELDAEGRIYWPKKTGGWPRYIRYLDDMKGVPLQDVWVDIPPVNPQAAERLGYPTQKPVALLSASSPPAATRATSCSTPSADAAPPSPPRRSSIAAGSASTSPTWRSPFRSTDSRTPTGWWPAKITWSSGEPQDLASAVQLSKEERHQFEWWALSLIGAQPINPTDDSGKQGKKGADKGIDGQLIFVDDSTGKGKRVIVQVKSGHVSASIVRDLRGVIEREGAAMGVLITLDPPSQPMKTEAASAGHYTSPGWNRSYPRLQILTVEGLLAGVERLDRPPTSKTFNEAPKEDAAKPAQPGLGLE
jgi:site-specific DNA-methyltransferase (adenine-specific)